MENQQSLKKWGEYLLNISAELKNKVCILLTEIFLIKHRCPRCDGLLCFMEDHVTECRTCHARFDPTEEFQRCDTCGGKLVKKTYYYHCEACNMPQRSIFSIDNWLYFPEYFADKMKASRQAKRLRREAMRALLATARSSIYMPESIDLSQITGFAEDLNEFLEFGNHSQIKTQQMLQKRFDFMEYRKHILDVIPTQCIIGFDVIQPFFRDLRLDRIFRFVTLIYMWQQREVVLMQNEDYIKVERL